MATNPLTGLTNFIFNGAPPANVETYGNTTTGIPDWLAQGSINLLNQSAGVAQGLSQSGYPLAGLPQIGAFNPNYDASMWGVSNARNMAQPYVDSAHNTNQWVQDYGGLSNLQAAQPYYDKAMGGYNAGLNANSLGLVDPYARAASSMSTLASASPYLNQGASYAASAAGQSYLPLAQSYIDQGIASNPLAAAAPYAQTASGDLAARANSLINGSYTQNVNDALATQSARNLEKFTMPQLNSSFIANGQAGSSRNKDYAALTTAYANQDLMAQQAKNLNDAYNSALGAAGQQQGTMAGLAGTMGNLGSQQQQALITAGTNLAGIGNQSAQNQLGAAGQLGAIGSTFGNLTASQQQALLNSGSLVGSTNTADTGQKLTAANGLRDMGTSAGTLVNSGIQNGLLAASQQAGLGQQMFNNEMTTSQGLDVLGQERQGYDTSAIQANNQNILNTANWTPQQLSWLSNILHGLPAQGGTTSTTNVGPASVYSPSPASQIAGLGMIAKYT